MNIRGWLVRDVRIGNTQPVAHVEAGGIITKHFKPGSSGWKCKHCGEVVAHPKAAAAHLFTKHESELKAYGTSDGASKSSRAVNSNGGNKDGKELGKR